MLRIFADKKWLPPGADPVIMLYPFWGAPEEDGTSPDYGRFEHYITTAKNNIEMVDTPQQADAVVLPFDYSAEHNRKKMTGEYARFAAGYNKPLLVFYNNDDATPIDLENAIIFRTSGYRSKKRKNEFGYPAWSCDFLQKYFHHTVKPQTPQAPTVSYCGYIDYRNTMEHLRFIVRRLQPGWQQITTGSSIRGKAIRVLQATPGIHTHFILRNAFWAGNRKNAYEARKQYVENIAASPYSLAVRGAGNFSYRFYEIFSSGRIPLFINTDCILPFDDFIDWKNECIWIEETALSQTGKRVIGFHNSLSADELAAKQIAARKLYEDWLSPAAFFKNIYRYIQHQPA